MIADLDLDRFNPDATEKQMAAGGLIPEGKYHARLDGATETSSQKTGNTGYELAYTLLAGPFAGKEVKDTVWKPEPGDTGPSANRFVIVASRVGLIGKKDGRYVALKEGFGDCIGAEVVIELNHREYAKKDGTKGKAANVTFAGVFAVDDPKCRDVIKAKGGAKPPRPAPKADTGGKKMDPAEL